MASFLLQACAFTLVLVSLSFAPTIAGNFVLDIHGQPIANSMDLFIEPQLYGTGGLAVVPRNNSQCPEYNIKQMVYSAGSPFSIAPLSTSTQSISTGQPVAIYFTHTQSSCNNLLTWSINPNKNSNYVIIDADQQQSSSTYYFTIEQSKESQYGYNIKFCSSKQGQCNALGIVNSVLGIKPSDPFPFVFVNANE